MPSTPPPNPHEPVFDLHGYSVDTACELAHVWVREAWEHGAASVTFIHGSAGASQAPKHSATGRLGPGGIKFALREALRNGDYRPYARPGRHAEHRLLADQIRIALEPCPDPDIIAWWSAPPRPDY